MTKQQLMEENELYKQFILHTHGKQALDRLKLEYAVQKTNDILSYEYRKEQYENLIQHIDDRMSSANV